MARCMFEGGRAALVRPASGGLPQIEHEVMHVVDRRLLLAHLEGEYIADRDHAGKAALGHDGQMADPLPRHHRGAFLDRRVGRAGRDRRRHDVRHLGRGGIAPRRDYATQDVALGEDADQPPALGHHEPTDAPLAHELGGLEHGFPRLHRDDVTALSGKNVLDGRHVTASWLGFPRYYRAVPGCATLSRPPEAGAVWRTLVSTSARSMRTPARSPARSRSSAVSPRSTASSRHSGFSPGSYARP